MTNMLSIREIKERTEAFFKEKGVPNPKLDTDILIAHSLGIKRLDLYLDLERPLTEAQLGELRPLVKRRADQIGKLHKFLRVVVTATRYKAIVFTQIKPFG